MGPAGVDRYEMALASIAVYAARRGIDAETKDDSTRDGAALAARLDDEKDQARRLLHVVIVSDLELTKPWLDAGCREFQARREAGRLMSGAYASVREAGGVHG